MVDEKDIQKSKKAKSASEQNETAKQQERKKESELFHACIHHGRGVSWWHGAFRYVPR